MRRSLAFTLALLTWLYAGDVYAALVTKWLKQSAQTTLLSTELNGLGNGIYSTIPGSGIDFTVGQSTRDGSLFCSMEGFFTFGANPTANTSITVWLLTADDGSNYESTPTSSVSLGRRPDAELPVTTGTTITRVRVPIMCPTGLVKTVAKNGAGQAMAATGNTVKVLPFTPQGVPQ